MFDLKQIRRASNQLYSDIIAEFSETRGKYDNDSKTFQELNQWRLQELPETLAQRLEDTKSIWLTKDELVLLMDWKLANGKFRATLPKLIRSNDESTVEAVTKQGFQIWLTFRRTTGTNDLWDDFAYKGMIKSSFKKLCELRGVGPATASLILSLIHKIDKKWAPPYFSDESFLYYVNPEDKIKYTVKEYLDLFLPAFLVLHVQDSDVSMDELERGAWALKMYELHKDDTLANVKPAEEDAPEAKAIEENGTKKRSRGSIKKELESEETEITEQEAKPKRARATKAAYKAESLSKAPKSTKAASTRNAKKAAKAEGIAKATKVKSKTSIKSEEPKPKRTRKK
ncbi:uncharacterized protein SPAPADRAFT_141865 [Spathaspora passalidarum NRRL Y-27907]|uniref:Uncharacterized protein n=1 Tax=Spathaspora passalidarum (strain NRRL Y-27907 / 11-Y1) TaxID=619300 RepID=G3ASG9_SPAPN|nr:uncharacterized protein SPAPADRAFT_141865 [Spathaspora passalidarum NRRL Y-27907]EGW31087.1 hypothetical protein SPAPADRAFT_141865 [Spathaspora passalidarum NRRL Y-27907]